ncbi:MAG: flagellar hook-basal body complex protein [Alphaproteobacteria bacterium]|nr:flagellar hook-basal body complex protein [Alphaproteobacteria bacterium]
MSSLFAALGVAVSGLSAQSQAIGNISDDLSNAQTTGYKSIGTNFSDLVTASSATDNSPGGVSAAPNYQNDVQGNIASTSTVTNLAISGQGFFNVTSASSNATGGVTWSGSNYYTRAGDFTLNKSGYMVNSAGYYLEGYAINDGVTDSASTVPVQISSLLDNPVASKAVTYVANLPASAADGYSSTASTVQIYDALGNTHQTSITWVKMATNQWLANIDVADGNGTGNDYQTQAIVTFNSASPAGTIESITTPTYDLAATQGSGANSNQITVTGTPIPPQVITIAATPTGGTQTNYSYTVQPGDTDADVAAGLAAAINKATTDSSKLAATSSSGVMTLTAGALDSAPGTVGAPTGYSTCSPDQGTTEAGLNFNLSFAGTASQSLDINLGTLDAATGVTQYANSSSTVSVSSISQDGLGEGSYSSIGIDSSGIVSINYTNGSTRQIYQIPIAQFNSPDNLQRGTGGIYTATLASGAANLDIAGTNGAGMLTSSSLESSDVDIASEFTTMIQSQQVYSANAKVVSTVNSMLNTIIQTVQ